MWIICIGAFILLFILLVVADENKKRNEEDARKEKLERECEQILQEVIAKSQEMSNHPRYMSLINHLVDLLDKHKDNLNSIGFDLYDNRIVLKLQDEQTDKFAPVRYGREFRVKMTDFDIEPHGEIEKVALLYVIVKKCAYLEFNYYSQQSRDLREAMFSGVNNKWEVRYPTQLNKHQS